MTPLRRLYGDSLSLLTDLYQLTMAHGYWRSGVAEREAVFHLFPRQNPFGGGFTLACGLDAVCAYLAEFGFRGDDLDYLGGLRGADGRPLFEQGFLDHLAALRLSVDVDAVPEGTVVFPHEPLVRVRGPILQGQILETALLNLINFPTLVATKAARMCEAAGGEPVLEFGLRRAQGIDGSLAAARAAYVGGCAATSNVLAGKLFDIPVRGTHAHSWVMSFDSELEAFRVYAEAMPGNCLFLVDTYDTLAGVRRAIEVGRELRERGQELLGVRLDSGDLAHLSIEARRLLDEAGFPEAAVVASNDLDEHIIASLKQQGAKIGVWGVGTKLATAFDQPALGGVYKLAAARGPGGEWDFKVKLSEQAIKISNPGVQQVRRYFAGDRMVADVIYDLELGHGGGEAEAPVMFDITDPTRRRAVEAFDASEDLLVPVVREGRAVYAPPGARAARARSLESLARLNSRTRRLLNPQEYPVGLEPRLHELKWRLVGRAREGDGAGGAGGSA